MKKCLLSLAFVAILLGLVGCEPLQPVVPTIQLEPSSLELFVGQKDTLVAIVSPEDLTVDCIWESSDTKVATVNKNGVVSAKGEGEAVITLTMCGECDVWYISNGPRGDHLPNVRNQTIERDQT